MSELPITELAELLPEKVKALVEDEKVFLGLRKFLAGEEFPAHFHKNSSEFFLCLSGELELYVENLESPLILKPGISHLVDPNTIHFLKNDSKSEAVLAFAKFPNLPEDFVPANWNIQKGN